MSLMRPDTVGSSASSSRLTAVAAPVRSELNIASLVPRHRDLLGDGGDAQA